VSINDKSWAKVESLVRRKSPGWQHRLCIDHFEIEHVFLDSYFGDDGEEDFKVTAVTECRPQYMQAKIKWFMPSAVRHDLETIESVLIHELAHVVLAPEQNILNEIRSSDLPAGEKIADLYSYQVEHCTELVARAIEAAYR
jgi:hypothetical protein